MTAANGGKRECGCWDGTPSERIGPTPGRPRCPRCDGTGYVWPSVEFEAVFDIPDRMSNADLRGLLVLLKNGHCRVLVQPLPAAQKEDGGE
jgi:hypothetical protein